MPSNHTTVGACSLEHKEHYDAIISGEWFSTVLKIVPYS